MLVGRCGARSFLLVPCNLIDVPRDGVAFTVGNKTIRIRISQQLRLLFALDPVPAAVTLDNVQSGRGGADGAL